MWFRKFLKPYKTRGSSFREHTFKEGGSREGYRNYFYANPINDIEITEENINRDFKAFCDIWKRFTFIRILRCTNAKIEFIDQFSEYFAWNNIFSNADYQADNFFNVEICFECENFDKLMDIINCIPQSVEKNFKLDKNYTISPHEGLEEDEDCIYTIKFSVHPALIGSKTQFRKLMNQYLREISETLKNIKI